MVFSEKCCFFFFGLLGCAMLWDICEERNNSVQRFG